MRNDIHRPGAIVPAEYRLVLSYNCATSEQGWPVPSFGINCELDRRQYGPMPKREIIKNGEHDESGVCCFIGARLHGEVFARQGSPGKCDVCGTAHVYGDIWRHEPTGELIVVGHICAAKYGLLADRSAFELELGRRKQAAATACIKAKNHEEREAFLNAEENAGLRQAFELAEKHYILGDLAAKFAQYRSLSPKQVALALKIADEVLNPKPEEKHVPAPTGRVQVTGKVVSVKCHESDFGPTMKMTVKTETPEGSWLVWCTIPSGTGGEVERGAVVTFKATLTAGREPYFAFGKRPSGLEVIERSPIILAREAEQAAAKAEREAEIAARVEQVAACGIMYTLKTMYWLNQSCRVELGGLVVIAP